MAILGTVLRVVRRATPATLPGVAGRPTRAIAPFRMGSTGLGIQQHPTKNIDKIRVLSLIGVIKIFMIRLLFI
jgi:hypothetical protein